MQLEPGGACGPQCIKCSHQKKLQCNEALLTVHYQPSLNAHGARGVRFHDDGTQEVRCCLVIGGRRGPASVM